MTDSKGFMQILILYVGPWPRGGDPMPRVRKRRLGARRTRRASIGRVIDGADCIAQAAARRDRPVRRSVPNAVPVIIGRRSNQPARSAVTASTAWRPRAPNVIAGGGSRGADHVRDRIAAEHEVSYSRDVTKAPHDAFGGSQELALIGGGRAHRRARSTTPHSAAALSSRCMNSARYRRRRSLFGGSTSGCTYPNGDGLARSTQIVDAGIATPHQTVSSGVEWIEVRHELGQLATVVSVRAELDAVIPDGIGEASRATQESVTVYCRTDGCADHQYLDGEREYARREHLPGLASAPNRSAPRKNAMQAEASEQCQWRLCGMPMVREELP